MIAFEVPHQQLPMSDSQLEKDCKRDFGNFTKRATRFWCKSFSLRVEIPSQPLAHLMLELAVHSPNPSMQHNPTATVFRNLLEFAMFHEEVEKQQWKQQFQSRI